MTTPSGAEACWACGSTNLTAILAIDEIPLSSLILMDDRDEAREFPRGGLTLAGCRNCAFIFNSAFRPEVVDYTMPYESSQDFSPRFRQFKQELIDHLVGSYRLRGKDVLEIGCGDASFLEALCLQGEARGFGIDPNYDPSRLASDSPVSGLKDFYDERHASRTGDLICCRHTLEHIQPVGDFVALTAKSAGQTPDAIVFFEIPDTERILEEGAFWDVYYEHCSYFTETSLSNLFRSQGFEILRLTKGYDDQYLLIDAKLGEPNFDFPAEDVAKVVSRAERFGATVAAEVRRWQTVLADADAAGRQVVLWGASSKAVAFLAAVDTHGSVTTAVDINPFKQDKYLPGSGVHVVAPEALTAIGPNDVIVMNPIYAEEIQRSLLDLGLRPNVHALGLDHPILLSGGDVP